MRATSLAGCVAALVVTAGAAGGQPVPHVLVEVQALEGFAQDGDHILWADTGVKSCRDVVKIRALSSGKTWSIYHGKQNPCGALGESQGFLHQMALGGTKGLWSLVGVSNSSYLFQLQRGGVGMQTTEVQALDTNGGLEEPNTFTPPALAGDGQTLLYTDVSNQEGRGFQYVKRSDGSTIAGTYGTLSLAASGNTFAAGRVEFGGCVCNGYPELSPDGSTLAYQSRRGLGGVQADGARWYLTRLDGTGGDRLLDVQGSFVWAPDGRHLLGFEHASAVELDTGTGAVRRIGVGYSASWSPSGDRVLYTRYTSSTTEVWVVGADGRDRRRVSSVPAAQSVAAHWSSDGAWIALQYGYEEGDIGVVPAGGGPVRIVARKASFASWAPVGDKLAFETSAGVSVVSASGGLPTQVGPVAGAVWWSPDGKWLADLAPASATPHLTLVAVDGSGTTDLGEVIFGPVWSPDSSQLAFAHSAPIGVVTRIVVAGPGRPERDIATGASVLWSPDGRYLMIDDPTEASQAARIFDTATGASASVHGWESVRWLADDRAVVRPVDPDGSHYDYGDLYLTTPALTSFTQLTHTVAAPSWQGVELRSARGALRARFTTRGPATAVALDGQHVAALFRVGSSKTPTVELRTRAGRLLRSYRVPASVDAISLSGRWLVYEDSQIEALDLTTGRVDHLAKPKGVVMGLSIEGTRVAWGEGRGSHRKDVILAVDLSR